MTFCVLFIKIQRTPCVLIQRTSCVLYFKFFQREQAQGQEFYQLLRGGKTYTDTTIMKLSSSRQLFKPFCVRAEVPKGRLITRDMMRSKKKKKKKKRWGWGLGKASQVSWTRGEETHFSHLIFSLWRLASGRNSRLVFASPVRFADAIFAFWSKLSELRGFPQVFSPSPAKKGIFCVILLPTSPWKFNKMRGGHDACLFAPPDIGEFFSHVSSRNEVLKCPTERLLQGWDVHLSHSLPPLSLSRSLARSLPSSLRSSPSTPPPLSPSLSPPFLPPSFSLPPSLPPPVSPCPPSPSFPPPLSLAFRGLRREIMTSLNLCLSLFPSAS